MASEWLVSESGQCAIWNDSTAFLLYFEHLAGLKINKFWEKNVSRFCYDFKMGLETIWEGFGVDLGGQVGTKIDKKSS